MLRVHRVPIGWHRKPGP